MLFFKGKIPVLLGAQIVMSITYLIWAIIIVKPPIEKIVAPLGMDIQNVITFQSFGINKDSTVENQIAADILKLEEIESISSVTPINYLPLSEAGREYSFSQEPPAGNKSGVVEASDANVYFLNQESERVLGLEVIDGRFFSDSEMTLVEGNKLPEIAIVTKSLAESIFNTKDVVGKYFYTAANDRINIIGVVEDIRSAWVSDDNPYNVILFPGFVKKSVWYYLAKTNSQDGVGESEILESLWKKGDIRLVRKVRMLEEVLQSSYGRERMVVGVLVYGLALGIVITILTLYVVTMYVSKYTEDMLLVLNNEGISPFRIKEKYYKELALIYLTSLLVCFPLNYAIEIIIDPQHIDLTLFVLDCLISSLFIGVVLLSINISVDLKKYKFN